MTRATSSKRRRRTNQAPYWLILPSLIYLALFFAWPMVRGLILAVREENVVLNLRSEADSSSPYTGHLQRGAEIEILDQKGNTIPPEAQARGDLVTETWYHVRAQDPSGQVVEGWTPERRIRVREQDSSGKAVAGTIRSLIGSSDTQTSVYTEASENSAIAGKLAALTPVEILDQTVLELWYQVRGSDASQPVEGWVPARYIQVFSGSTRGRVAQGDAGQYTARYLQRMVNDRFFMPALKTTLLLMVMIIPVQFVLAIIMALVIQANPRGSGFFLYLFSIALGVSDLAVGILWYSIFTELGFLNSILQGLGLIDAPLTYLSAKTTYWIIIAVWLAEVWRATSIVMVIVVSGMQAISREVLEAAEVFGATLWQRIRHVILPLLRPSLQVALILRTILALQVFAVVIALGGGNVVTVLANETYRQYYTLRNFNMAAAYASFILVLSMITAVFYLRAVRTHEEVAT